MYAVLVDEKQNLNWTEVPDPVAGENEVLIEIHAAALNRADLLQRAGKYPPPPGWPGSGRHCRCPGSATPIPGGCSSGCFPQERRAWRPNLSAGRG